MTESMNTESRDPNRFKTVLASRCFNPRICLLRLITTSQKFDFPVHLLDILVRDLKTNNLILIDLLGRNFTFHLPKVIAIKKLYRLPLSEVKETINSFR